ncbi:hypothetical protein DIPPA_24051 [Diplonema papillatum]|nr:hypothetical protein DIPPA_05043 [Diplonema papillatum]KAJ9442790.1 hypothetical protein DIPPA_24051 [Diplonema papillatum]|eukprot:gene10918-16785_t
MAHELSPEVNDVRRQMRKLCKSESKRKIVDAANKKWFGSASYGTQKSALAAYKEKIDAENKRFSSILDELQSIAEASAARFAQRELKHREQRQPYQDESDSSNEQHELSVSSLCSSDTDEVSVNVWSLDSDGC